MHSKSSPNGWLTRFTELQVQPKICLCSLYVSYCYVWFRKLPANLMAINKLSWQNLWIKVYKTEQKLSSQFESSEKVVKHELVLTLHLHKSWLYYSPNAECPQCLSLQRIFEVMVTPCESDQHSAIWSKQWSRAMYIGGPNQCSSIAMLNHTLPISKIT